MTTGESVKPDTKKIKMARFFFEREPSVRKQNIERESRISFLARMNFLFAFVIFCNLAYAVYTITRPHGSSPVIVQYFSDAGKFKEIKTVSFAELPAVRLTGLPQVPLMADPFAAKPAAAVQLIFTPVAAAPSDLPASSTAGVTAGAGPVTSAEQAGAVPAQAPPLAPSAPPATKAPESLPVPVSAPATPAR